MYIWAAGNVTVTQVREADGAVRTSHGTDLMKHRKTVKKINKINLRINLIRQLDTGVIFFRDFSFNKGKLEGISECTNSIISARRNK